MRTTLRWLVGVSALLIACGPASAVTYTVDSTGDGTDPLPSDCVCDDGAGACTLRAAIVTVNACSGTPNTIDFNIAGGCPQTITLGSDLPDIVASNVTLDGTTQAGSGCGDLLAGTGLSLCVVVDANNITDGGIVFSGNGATVRGLEVKNVAGSTSASYGIRLNDSSTAQCNYSHNNWGGFFAGSGNLVGGLDPGDGNLANGNTLSGLSIFGNGTTLWGNVSGMNSAGTAAVPNGTGVFVENGISPIIGGQMSGARNIISGNSGAGVLIDSDVTGAYVIANYVGYAFDGTTQFCNGTIVDDQGVGTYELDNLGCVPPPADNVCCNVDTGGVGLTCIDNNVVSFSSLATCQTWLNDNFPGSTALEFVAGANCEPDGEPGYFGGACGAPIILTPTPSPTPTPQCLSDADCPSGDVCVTPTP